MIIRNSRNSATVREISHHSASAVAF